MSRTDKDRPYRLREYDDGYIDHDHRSGECRVESREQALMPTWRHMTRHYRNCKKYEIVAKPCRGAVLSDIIVGRWGAGYKRGACGHACRSLETKRMHVSDPTTYWLERVRFFNRYGNDRVRFFCAEGVHDERVYHADWPCVCDDTPPGSTCDYRLSRADGGGYCIGGVPTWYCRETYHRPQRREMRDVLNSARRDYNANGDTDIEPVNRQARNSAHWSWW